MPSEILQGLVLKKQPINDNDELITLLTNEELISLVSIGSLKLSSKNRNALVLYSFIEFEFFRARLKNRLSKLKKATLLKSVDLKSSDNAEVIFTILQKIKQINSPSPKLLSAILETYAHFGFFYNHQIKTYVLFASLEAFGLKPILNQCVACQKRTNIVDFNFDNGGFICKNHAKSRLNLDILRAFRLLTFGFTFYKDVDHLVNKQVFEMLITFLNQFIY